MDREAEQTLLSHALTAACAPDPSARQDQRAGQPNVLGWATWYLTTWGGQTKTQLSSDLNTSVRNMNVYADRTHPGGAAGHDTSPRLPPTGVPG